MLVGSVIDAAEVVGGVAALLAITESARRLTVGTWRFLRAVVKFADAVPKVIALAEKAESHPWATALDLQAHAAEDASFQQVIMRRQDQGD